MKLWGGRFKEKTDRLVDEFTASIGFDKRLYKVDIIGSMAHALMLAKTGIISNKECVEIVKGLEIIIKEIETGKFKFSAENEDIHMHVEKRLIELTGISGEKLHTARSRNDQIALDIRLYLRIEIEEILVLIDKFQQTLYSTAMKNIDVIIPGYTHLQRAQPVLFSHHILAYFEMLERDKERFEESIKRVNVMPLGSGALAGVTYPIDREFVAGKLGFDSVSKNSIDAVSDRDFIIEFIADSAILMMHLSRFCEDLIIWSSFEFDFIELSDSHTTGSSIMPQKKNPDVAELIRGKTGRVYGSLISLLTVMKGLPLAYNKDLQEDKEPIFDTVETVTNSLKVFDGMVKKLKVKKDKIAKKMDEGFLLATEAADYLVLKGLSFRKAHEVVGKLVSFCIETNQKLEELPLNVLKKHSPLFQNDCKSFISMEAAVDRRKTYGGTSKSSVKQQLNEIKKRFAGNFKSSIKKEKKT